MRRDPFDLVADLTIDVTSTSAVVARLLARGLRAEGITAWRGVEVREIRLRAPAGVWPYPLDVPWATEIGRIEATLWARDASRSEGHVRRYVAICQPEVRGWRAQTARAEAALAAIGLCYPSLDVLAAALAAVLATAEPTRASERLASVSEVAEVLGCSIEALRVRMRRGEVRSVRVGARRAIPWAEVERLVSEAGTR